MELISREQAIQEVMVETGEPYEIVADMYDAIECMAEEEELCEREET